MQTTRWLHAIHQWTGLISGLNVLVLSLTGAFLVFAEDIEHFFAATSGTVVAEIPSTSQTPVQDAIAQLTERHPGAIPAAVRPLEPGATQVVIALLERPDTFHRYAFDPGSGEVRIDVQGWPAKLYEFMLHLHTDLFLGIMGGLFLGGIAILFLVSTLTGIIIYAPFMKKAIFGAIRVGRGVRHTSADVHKLVGASALAFNLMMALTGIALTFGLLGARVWAAGEVRDRTQQAAPVAAAKGAVAGRAPVDEVLEHAAAVHPEAPVSSVVFPGGFQGPNHYFCFHEREGRLQKHLPVYSLIPADNPAAAEDVDVPLWIDIAMFCVPVHFGNYGGLLLKFVYCALGLGSGLLTVTGSLVTLARWRRKLRARRVNASRRTRVLQPDVAVADT
ncbi:MAG: hypothetical protein AMXMBFR82_21720 [Candidatus Hydrogenedentota bacterium]